MPPSPPPADDRSLPLRERKRLRTRRTLAATALRMFTEGGFDATTLEALTAEAEVSRSTFFRAFPAKEAVAIEAEAEMWRAFEAALADRALSGLVLTGLRDTLTEATAALPPDWDERYVATRRLVLTAPALLAYVEHHRTGVEKRVAAALTERLALDQDDLRPEVLAELATTAWSVAARGWVGQDGAGGREVLLTRLRDAFAAIPAGLHLTADPPQGRPGLSGTPRGVREVP
ncbi:TetR family transcriptional regulator [Streptomyces sp. NPDC058374]|uniref:TetR family transcriptional regulator n=1 Tax=unclassified Streptomyces TaxID=2593676 RepID=UPI003657202D